MIVILDLNRTIVEQFDNFNELFDCLLIIENLKHSAMRSDFRKMNWSFKMYSPKQVVTLYANSKNPCATMQEAFEDNLSLIEICAGDYRIPLYIVLSRNIDIDYLKKKWCIDYCTYHHLLVREGIGI